MKSIREIVRNVINDCIKEKTLEESSPYQVADDETMQQMMDAMDANLDSQEEPKVGIFWYSPTTQRLFGVVAVNAYEQAKIENRKAVSCKELHKYVWKKKYNYYKYHGGSKEFVGDYKYTPRGRVFYFPKTDEFRIMVGDWINEYPHVIDMVKEEFDLNQEGLKVKTAIGSHWQIGMGYGD